MENATKALLIAAAVIVAILLISLGIGVFNIGQEQTQNADLTEYQKQQFNDKFTKYQGTKTGAEVNALVQTVFNHNNAQSGNETCVTLTGTVALAGTPGLQTMPNKLPVANSYTVTITYNNGLVQTINVQ